jgi:NAD(P)-dependent dehydrogenase (short-subunit alcohol dehydrogenase family)
MLAAQGGRASHARISWFLRALVESVKTERRQFCDAKVAFSPTIPGRRLAKPPASVLSVYAATKSALTAFTRALARELGPKAVTVNIVQPGSIDTDMNPAHEPFGDTLRQFMALGHYGEPEDIADAVAFLASAKAKYITGSTLTVDGGANA